MVALRWLWGRNALAINTLWGGFDVALGGFAQPISAFQHFSFSAFRPRGPVVSGQ
jgi:hypothetical protein